MSTDNATLANDKCAVTNTSGCSFKSVVKSLCKICEDKAYRRYFGVMSCEHCKAFYQRSVIRGTTYTCLEKDSNCAISFHTKANHCKLCLFNKCENSGMSRFAVKLARKPAVKHLPIGTPCEITKLNKAYTQLFKAYDRRVIEEKIRPLLLSDEPLDKAVSSYKAAMFSQLCSHYEKLVKDLVQFTRRVPGFTELHPDDQLILLKTGFIDIWSLLNTTRLSRVQDSVTLSDGTQIPICEVTTVYTKEYVTSIMDLSDECRSLKLLPSDKAILIALALTNPDRPNVIDKAKIAELKASYISSMNQYAVETRPNNANFSRNMLNVLSNMNDIGKQHSLLLNMYRADVRKLSVSPVITELFDLHPLSAYKES